MVTKSYFYRPKLVVFILSTLFFGLVAAILTYAASTNEQGALINGLIELSVDQTTLFYWVLAAASYGFVILGFTGTVLHFTAKNSQLVFHDEFLEIPPILFHRRHRVIYRDVRALKWFNISGTEILEMHTSRGKVGISNRMFRSQAEFTEACGEVERLVTPFLPR